MPKNYFRIFLFNNKNGGEKAFFINFSISLFNRILLSMAACGWKQGWSLVSNLSSPCSATWTRLSPCFFNTMWSDSRSRQTSVDEMSEQQAGFSAGETVRAGYWKTFGCSQFQSCLRSSAGRFSSTVIPLRVFSHPDTGSFQLVKTIRLIMGCYVKSCGAASGMSTIADLFWPWGKFALNPNWKGFSFYCGALM